MELSTQMAMRNKMPRRLEFEAADHQVIMSMK